MQEISLHDGSLVENPDFPFPIKLHPIEKTTYGYGKYKFGTIRQQESRLRFKFPDHKDQYEDIAKHALKNIQLQMITFGL